MLDPPPKWITPSGAAEIPHRRSFIDVVLIHNKYSKKKRWSPTSRLYYACLHWLFLSSRDGSGSTPLQLSVCSLLKLQIRIGLRTFLTLKPRYNYVFSPRSNTMHHLTMSSKRCRPTVFIWSHCGLHYINRHTLLYVSLAKRFSCLSDLD